MKINEFVSLVLTEISQGVLDANKAGCQCQLPSEIKIIPNVEVRPVNQDRLIYPGPFVLEIVVRSSAKSGGEK